MNIIDQAYHEAKEVLHACAKPIGFFASGLPGGYEALWARDSMMTALGGSTVGKRFQKPFLKSIHTLSKHQSASGQIPNAVGTYNTDRRSWVTYNTIDSSLWYIIGCLVYHHCYGDSHFLKRYRKNIHQALLWLIYQDPDEVGLLAQLPTMDWQDAFPHKYGYVLSTQALYYAVLRLIGENHLAEHIQKVVNGRIQKHLSLYDKKRGYYLPWVWKNHDGIREEEYWFDTFGNLFAIVSGLATPSIAKSILSVIEKKHIHRPYPCRAIFPPITKNSRNWQPYFLKSDAKRPYFYLNGGIWPFIGGWYIAALIKTGKRKEAERELVRLAEANMMQRRGEGGFHEWLHGKTGAIGIHSTPYQGWSAGMYLFAFTCVQRNDVPFFL